jgi:hypothetical protein
VQCALPADRSVQIIYRGSTMTAGGVANLGPGIQSGEMTVTEQKAVSACLLARVNARGDVVSIDMWGPFAGFNTTSSAELAQFTVTEAGFFGNVFAYPPQAWIYTAPSYNTCSSRACLRPDGSCDCGILAVNTPSAATSYCNQNGVMQGTTQRYFDDCNYPAPSFGLKVEEYRQIITTRIAVQPLGAQCAANWECQSEICAGGVCSSPFAMGAACLGDYECQTQNCQAGLCAPKRPLGASCANGGECASGGCSWAAGDVCAKTEGMACSSPYDCVSFDCYHGKCGGGLWAGDACTKDLDCAFHRCSRGACYW